MTPPDAVAEAHVQYRTAVERAAARILRDHDAASDVASEAFLAMLERGPDDRQAALAWLLTTARNRALNVIRARQRAARRPLDPTQVPDEAAPSVADSRETDLIARALARLSDRDQAALLLRYVRESSPTEIAAVLGVTTPVARVVVHRAAKRLRVETVRLLAQHHGAAEPCEQRLQKLAAAGIPSGHDGCGACTAVADEIAALATHALIPVAALPVVRHATGRVRDLIASIKPHVNGIESRAAEAAAVLLIATGLTAPAFPAATAAPAPAAQSTADVARRVTGTAASTAARTLARTPSRVAAPSTFVSDAEGDTQQLVGPPPGVRLLGKTIRLPDALDRSAKPGNDIRSFAVYTQADRAGRPDALVFLLGMAGEPPAGSSFTVGWGFGGTACTGTAVVQLGDQTTGATTSSLSASCPQELETITAIESKPASWFVELPLSVTANIVAIHISLRSIPDGMKELMRPGRTLTELIATSSTSAGVVYTSVDQAPDDYRGLEYTIGSR